MLGTKPSQMYCYYLQEIKYHLQRFISVKAFWIFLPKCNCHITHFGSNDIIYLIRSLWDVLLWIPIFQGFFSSTLFVTKWLLASPIKTLEMLLSQNCQLRIASHNVYKVQPESNYLQLRSDNLPLFTTIQKVHAIAQNIEQNCFIWPR